MAYSVGGLSVQNAAWRYHYSVFLGCIVTRRDVNCTMMIGFVLDKIDFIPNMKNIIQPCHFEATCIPNRSLGDRQY